MKRAFSQHIIAHFLKVEQEEVVEVQEKEEEEVDDVAHLVGCISLHKKSSDSSEDLSIRKYRSWFQKQKRIAARREKQIKASMALDDFIEEQMKHFHAQYSRGVVPTHLKDLSKLLMPKSTPPNELAALSWLGDWRPSSFLDLLRSLSHSLPSLSKSKTTGLVLSKLTHDVRIEEAVIDEEMAEIQANCILHLHFGQANKHESIGQALASIHSEFKKIHAVIIKAQKLRYKVLELIVKNVLSQTDAAEFLVAFAGIQDSIHQIARDQRMQKGSVYLSMKPQKSS
ncbi:hypothetical protein DCAR_0729328 [Daucus carota subsp. sativus]|uniref:DOG1 domain-containing protein n=1 Tax=Daucus carota subsp. sativus TaxID=79200 RepID=A0AAF0XKT8_DAUCS|nr:hypothetical protein DCAR_0729328 [Daucus carota subsp. sativus]